MINPRDSGFCHIADILGGLMASGEPLRGTSCCSLYLLPLRRRHSTQEASLGGKGTTFHTCEFFHSPFIG